MKNVVIDFDSQSVEFKFMVTNRDVVTNSNLRQEIQKYGIAQDLIVMPIEEYDGQLNDSIGFRFGEGESAGVYVVIDGQHRLTCLNEIVAKIGNHAAVHNLLALELDNLACRTQHDDIVGPRLDAGIGCEGLVTLLFCDNLDWRDTVDVGESLVELLLRNVESLDIGLVVGLAPGNPQILDTLVLKEHVVVEVAGHLPYERA